MNQDMPDTSNEAIGRRIAAVRHARGWTQAFMAKLLDVSPQRLGNWERGAHAPYPDQLAKIWQVTGATSDFVLFGQRAGLPVELAEAMRGDDDTPSKAGRKAG